MYIGFRFQVSGFRGRFVGANSFGAGRRLTPYSLLLILVVLPLLAACGGDGGDAKGATETGRVVRVETLVLSPTSFEDVVQVTGAVEAIDDAVLSAQSAGTVTSLAPLGRVVSAGQTVAQLDPFITRSTVDQTKAGVEAAEAQFELAEDNMTRNTPLYKDSVISAIEYENVRAQFNRAKADLARARAMMSQAEEQLRQTRVAAPFTGTVEERFVEIGEQVLPGRQIARIINTSRVKVTAGVPERYAADIRVGTPAQVDFSAYRGQPVQSRVSFVGSAINRDNRTFPVEILLENGSSVFKPEMVA
ncbi:MAG: efflux RND transporter periplasmic adaptor subunit, partial [Rhodothermales bacterium]